MPPPAQEGPHREGDEVQATAPAREGGNSDTPARQESYEEDEVPAVPPVVKLETGCDRREGVSLSLVSRGREAASIRLER